MKPTEKQKELYKKLSPMIGIEPRVIKYGDDNDKNYIFIMECPDPIDDKIKFYSTIGLSDYFLNERKYEILFTGYSNFEEIGNILSSCAFFIINENWKITHGTVFETLVSMYYKDIDMKHVYFTTPYIWEDKLEDFEIQGDKIFFLLGIPISDAELSFKNLNGIDALENLFQEHNIDIFDINRKSII